MKQLATNNERVETPLHLVQKTGVVGQETPLFISKEIKTIRSSQQLGWRDIFAAHTTEQPHEGVHQPAPFFWLSMGLRDTEVRRTYTGKNELACLPAYSITMAEPLTSIECCIGNETEAVHVFVTPALMSEVAGEMFDMEGDRVSLLPVFGEKNESLRWLLCFIRQALAEPAHSSRLKIDYLSRALCAELLSKYATRLPERLPQVCALTARHIRLLNEYIQEHLCRDIQIGELASLCGMGRTTFHQRFKATMHMTPYQYVMRLRVEKAKEMLMHSNLTLAEISLICGFSDQAHFATLFKRISGLTPAAFRRAAA